MQLKANVCSHIFLFYTDLVRRQSVYPPGCFTLLLIFKSIMENMESDDGKEMFLQSNVS